MGLRLYRGTAPYAAELHDWPSAIVPWDGLVAEHSRLDDGHLAVL